MTHEQASMVMRDKMRRELDCRHHFRTHWVKNRTLNTQHGISTFQGSWMMKRVSLLLAFVLTGAFCTLAADTLPTAPQPAAAQSFRLEHKPLGFRFLRFRPLDSRIHISLREAPFTREPALGNGTITRGKLFIGPRPEDAMLFILDSTRPVLYLDLNGNSDLSDDPSGVFVGKHQSTQYYIFHPVTIALPRGDGLARYTIGLRFDLPRSTATMFGIFSGWQGRIELGGKPHSMAIVDNLDGMVGEGDLLFLKVSGTEERIRWHGETADSWDIPAAPTLFINGYSYELSLEFGKQDGDATVTFTPTPPPMGALEIEGRYIARLILVGSRTVVWDHPHTHIPVPADTYSHCYIFLHGGKSAGVLVANLPGITVPENGTATLKAGAPLTHVIETENRRKGVRLRSTLQGVGGEEYGTAKRDHRQRPHFAVYRGRKRVAGGQFGTTGPWHPYHGRFGQHRPDCSTSVRLRPSVYGALRAVPSWDIGRLGPKEGKPVRFGWRPAHHPVSAPAAGILGLFCLALLLRSNRDRRAWLVLLPAFLVVAVMSSLSATLEGDLGIIAMGGAWLGLGWAMVWAHAETLARAGGLRALLGTIGPLFGVGFLVMFAQADGAPMLVHALIYWALAWAGLAALRGARALCRQTFKPWRFMLWLFLWCVLFGLLTAGLAGGWASALDTIDSIEQQAQRALASPALGSRVLVAGVAAGLTGYAVLLPFMCLTFTVPFFRNRFDRAFRFSVEEDQ